MSGLRSSKNRRGPSQEQSTRDAAESAPSAGQLWRGLEQLEDRVLMAATLVSALPTVNAVTSQATTAINLTPHFDDTAVAGSVVKFDTVMGVFYVEMFDVASGMRTAAPLTVTNFLHHVNNDPIANSTTGARYNSYANTLIHRSDKSLGVVQGGGFGYPNFNKLTGDPTVNNEYSDTRKNTRGTLAMAKVGGNPNSATNQWFFNTKDNSTTLGPTNNGGFTTFGQVLGTGMTIVDAILNLPVFTATSLHAEFGTQFPLRNTPPVVAGDNNVVLVNNITVSSDVLYTATSDSALVVPSINGTTLNLDFLPGQTGVAHVKVRATDHTGTFVESTFEVNVGAATNPPVLTTVTTSPTRATRGKTNIKLTAAGISDLAPGTVTAVEFYHDSNRNGTLEPGVDRLLGKDTTATDGYTLTTVSSGLPGGANRFFARAVDNDNQASVQVFDDTTIVNSAPKYKKSLTLGTIQRNTATNLSYQLLAAVSDETDANNDPLVFRIESVVSGTLKKNGVAVVPGTTTVGPGEAIEWTPATDADGILPMFTMVAFDGELASSKPVTILMTVNSPPTVTKFSVKPLVLPFAGSELTLTATAKDSDGTLAKVEFFRDVNGNGIFDSGTDTKIGEDTNKSGGWTFKTSNTTAFPAGTVRYFARATDTQGGVGPVFPITATVNGGPNMGALSATSPVTRPGDITLSVPDVTDDQGVTLVEFFLDVNGNSQIDTTDLLLGPGVKSAGTNTYTLAVPTTSIPVGTPRFIARGTDTLGAKTVKSITATVAAAANNTPPEIVAVTPDKAVVNRGQVVVLTAGGVADINAGGVQRVEFYRDDGDNTFEPAEDTLITTDFSAADGWTASHTIPTSLATGARRFFARSFDFDGASSGAVATDVTINPPPTIGTFTSSVSTVARGGALTVTANTVTDTLAGTVSKVEFFRDAPTSTNPNGSGGFDAADILLFTDSTATDGFKFDVPTLGLPASTIRFFARATDNNGAVSIVATLTVPITNAVPTLTAVTVNPTTAARNQTVKFTATGPADVDGAVAKVEFYQDVNKDGVVNTGDIKLGEDTKASSGWTLSYKLPATAPLGDFKVLAVAVDNNNGRSAPALTTLAVTNVLPTLKGLKATPSSIVRPSQVTLTASGAADADGGPGLALQFFLDLNGNKAVDAGDLLLGEDNSATDGYTFTFNSDVITQPPAGTSGTVTYLSRVRDADGGFSAAKSITQRVT